jgi:hypothetical protein
VCRHLGLDDLVRVCQSCKRFGHGGLETADLRTESPFVAILRKLAFPCLELVPRVRPTGSSESWVAYLARCARQRRCRETPSSAAGDQHSLFVDAGGRLLACGKGEAVSHARGDGASTKYTIPAPVAAMAAVRVRSVAAGSHHGLALVWDGRVHSWGQNTIGCLGHGDKLDRPLPALVEGLQSLRASPQLVLTVSP